MGQTAPLSVLVTGASGRIGRAIVVRLALTHRVSGLDRTPSSTAEFVGDVCDRRLLERALDGIDAVVHVAALHAPHVGLVGDAEFQRINVDGTRTLLLAARRAGVRHLVFTSTTALYGAAADPQHRHAAWIDEETPPAPRTVYHRSKLAAEALLADAALADGPAVTLLRMSRCFPEPAPLMAAYRLHRGIDARDVAEAHALALLHPPSTSRCLVVSGATPFEPDDAAQLLNDAPAVIRRRAPALAEAFERRGWPLPTSIDRVYSSQLAQQVLGWQPRFGFDEVLREFDACSPEVLPPRTDWNAVE
ncbi:NAD(P)-dependent oxidoreductase [Aquincola sp. S2]|uniref:NAD(P)-dependent oxidoreductase n=1 Tax=Pseudaquabacterium terrae TaxID=2732868 RepID=A0ABX2ERW0_9BURK|nr:NAD(P)-dependent oxidoreductase [Aquabacterium terrae]NRF71475.1 NAD(P)-dependent oxidoreductase [Aquabacterium terrae]